MFGMIVRIIRMKIDNQPIDTVVPHRPPNPAALRAGTQGGLMKRLLISLILRSRDSRTLPAPPPAPEARVARAAHFQIYILFIGIKYAV